MGMALSTKKMSGTNAAIVDSTHCANKAILLTGKNDIGHISNQVLTVIKDKLV
jgi:hypothetical protein